MKIKSVHVENFKRFKNLTIDNLGEEARLVVIVGTNGSGKSSLFDAFLRWYQVNSAKQQYNDEAYYRKNKGDNSNWNNIRIEFHGTPNLRDKRNMYFRTAYRNDPDFNVLNINKMPPPYEENRFTRIIDNDVTVGSNYQRLVVNSIANLYDEVNDNLNVKELRERLIGKLQTAMKNVFGDLILNNISDPLSTGSFLFNKGNSKSYHYKNLSGGEKTAFDLLLDLILKIDYYPDTIFFIDEPETHLHNSLQGKLLKELFAIVPQNSQVWITTHSLGIMRAVKEIGIDHPNSIAVLDFDEKTFDEEAVISPAPIDKSLWEKFLSIALDDFSARIAPAAIYICEGSLTGNRRYDFDAGIYNKIFQRQYPEIIFISGGSCNELENPDYVGYRLLNQLLRPIPVIRVLDRDDKTEEEVITIQRNGMYSITKRRHLESYLFDDEIITKLVLSKTNDTDMREKALRIKNNAISASVLRHNPFDDVKSAAGDIYNGLKELLNLTQSGSNQDAFMQSTLAPLVTPETVVYQELEREIIKR